jgi:hypothetical protein
MKNKSKPKLMRTHGRSITACLFLIAFVGVAVFGAGLFPAASGFAKESAQKTAAPFSYQATVMEHAAWTSDAAARPAVSNFQSKIQPTVEVPVNGKIF